MSRLPPLPGSEKVAMRTCLFCAYERELHGLAPKRFKSRGPAHRMCSECKAARRSQAWWARTARGREQAEVRSRGRVLIDAEDMVPDL